MSKSATLKHSIRFQEWVAQVQEFNARPEGMSMTAWCKQQGMPVSTFMTRMHKVQDAYLCQTETSLPGIIEDTAMVPIAKPAFVELPMPSVNSSAVARSNAPAAVITYGKAKLEINDDVSEAFLIKLLGALSHA